MDAAIAPLITFSLITDTDIIATDIMADMHDGIVAMAADDTAEGADTEEAFVEVASSDQSGSSAHS